MTEMFAVARFVPGLLGLLFWPRATRSSLPAGLARGATALAASVDFSTTEPWGFATFGHPSPPA